MTTRNHRRKGKKNLYTLRRAVIGHRGGNALPQAPGSPEQESREQRAESREQRAERLSQPKRDEQESSQEGVHVPCLAHMLVVAGRSWASRVRHSAFDVRQG